eukprot:COSAG02_NODE_2232_length_9428_cov_3.232286_2_plen_1507_part_00
MVIASRAVQSCGILDMAQEKEPDTKTAAALQAYRQKQRQEKEEWVAGVHATHGEGEGYFGNWKSTRVDERTVRDRQRGTGRGHAFVRPGLPEDDALRKSHRPHMWSSRLYGEAHGDWESDVAAHPHPVAVADPTVVYEAYGGAWSCRSCHASKPAGQMHHCAACWATRKKWDLCDECWLHLRVARFDSVNGCTVDRLEEFEWEIRDALHAANAWHDRLAETPRAMLMRILSQGDQGVLLGGKPTRLIAASNFQRLIATHLLGKGPDATAVVPSEQEVRALFAKYGQTSTCKTTVSNKYEDYEIWRASGPPGEGLLPYDVFARSLLAGASVQLAKRGFRRGPLRLDEPAEWPKQSMIRYPQCTRAILPPSSWDGTKVARSAQEPQASLKLSNIFGYVGRHTTGPSLVYTRTGEVVYHVASVAVVGDLESKQQRFFQGHDNSITALALHPFENMVATGQRVPKGSTIRPVVLVWDPFTMEVRTRLELGPGHAFVCALCFCGAEGEFLVSVSGNEDHTIRLWNWRDGEVLSELPTKKGSDQPLIYGVRGNPYPLPPDATQRERENRAELVVFGHNFLLFYWLNEETNELEQVDPSSGNCSLDVVFRDACFLRSGHVIAAGENGQLSIFYEGQGVQQVVNPHEPEEQSFHVGGIRSMRTVPSDLRIRAHAEMDVDEIVTAGADGIVRQWELKLEDFPTDLAGEKAPQPMGVRKQIPELPDDHQSVDPSSLPYRPSIVSLDVPYEHDTQKLLVGDAAGCIWEFDDQNDADSQLLFPGHAGDVMDVSAHPIRSSICATTGTDGCVYVWYISEEHHQLVRKIRLPVREDESGDALRAWKCSFSTDGTMLAVSTAGVVGTGAAESVDTLPYSVPPVEGSSVVVLDVDELLNTSEEDLCSVQFYCKDCHQTAPNIVCEQCNNWCADGLAVGEVEPRRICQLDDVGMIEALRFSPDDRYLAIGGHQRVVRIYAVPPLDEHGASDQDQLAPRPVWPKRHRVAKCVGHSATVLHLDWSSQTANKDGTPRYTLRSTSADYDIMHWDVIGRQQLNNQRDTIWHNWSSTLGFEVMGIWTTTPTPSISRDRKLDHGYISEVPSRGAVLMPDAATINALHRSPCESYIVTGDDNSDVRLFNYPCVVADAPAHNAGLRGRSGHSSFVTGVQWSTPKPDHGKRSQFVLSSGGHDGTLFQWTVDYGRTSQQTWEQRVERAQFIAADDRGGVRRAAGFDGPREGYTFREDGPNGKGYYRAPAVQQWQDHVGATRASDKLERLRQTLPVLPIAQLRELADQCDIVTTCCDPHSNLALDVDDNDRAQLIAMLVEHEAATMGPAREAASRIPDDVIEAAEQVQMLELNVREQEKQIESRQEEIEKLHRALGVEDRHEDTENLDRALAPFKQDDGPRGFGCVSRRVALSETDGSTPSTRGPSGSCGDNSAPHRLRAGLGPVKAKAGQAGQAGSMIKALRNWTAQRVVEITFSEGELLTLLRKENDEWWLAKLNNGQRGLVESRHFVMLDTK